MIEVKNLVKKYGDKVAIDGLNFNIEAGEIVGLLGLNGAGKSTTMNCLTGYIAPTAGSISIDGHDLLKEPNEAKKVIGYLPEIFSFYPDMRIVEYLDFVCDLKGFTPNKKIRKEHIEKICEQTGISHLSQRMIRNLSKGYKQRVGFAQALIGNPKVLILDEPTVGLDPSQIIEIRQLIKDSGKDSTVIVSSHILSEIQTICNRVIIIHDGHIAADGSMDTINKNIGSGNEVNIRVKGNRTVIENALKSVSGIKKIVHLPVHEDGCEDYTLSSSNNMDIREGISKSLANAGVSILEIYSKETSLESIFLRLTNQDKKGRVK